jgi:hypothetical protein
MTTVTNSPGLTQAVADMRYSVVRSVQNASPTAGQTVAMTDDSTDGTLNLTPAGLLATATVTFPSDANSRIGQVRRITSSQIVTALTLNGATILNPLAALAVNTNVAFEKTAANTWMRQ